MSDRPPRSLARRWVRLDRRQAAFLAVVAFGVAVLGVVYAEPIQDGDLFWHLAYARQMVNHHTLIPDPKLYSWTPTSGRTIYCAWLSELFLYSIWRLTGLWGFFVLRYAVLAGVVGLLWRHAWRLGLGRRLVTALVILVVALASSVGTIVKPELFSLLLFNGVLFAYFGARAAARRGADARPWLLAVPLIVLVWVNAHGAFILGAPLLGATALGEVANACWNPAAALPPHARRWLLGSWAACGLAILVTPYGPRYPLQLIGDYVFQNVARPDEAWNVAHLSIFDHRAIGLHLVEYGLAALILGAVAVVAAQRRSGRRVDAVLVLANLAYLPLFAVHLRTSYFWPAVFGYSVLEWLALSGARAAPAPRRPTASRPSGTAARRTKPASKSPVGTSTPTGRRWVAAVIVATFVALGTQAAYSADVTPHTASWLGYGIGYVNPVVEARYIEREHLGPRLYNIFDSGGYLLWRLYPRDRVMVDSRSFPYLSWFNEQRDFTNGVDVPRFVERHPGNVAVIDLAKPGAWQAFVALPDWRPVFYGPTAVVFVRNPRAPLLTSSDHLWSWRTDLRNADTALNVFDLATYIGDFRTAWTVLDQLRGPLADQSVDGSRRQAASDFQAAYDALNAHQDDQALTLLQAGLQHRAASDHDQLVLQSLVDLQRARITGQTTDAARIEHTLEGLAAPARRASSRT